MSKHKILKLKYFAQNTPCYGLIYSQLILMTLGMTFFCSCTNVKIPIVPSKNNETLFQPSEIVLTPRQEKVMGLKIANIQVQKLPVLIKSTGEVKAMASQIEHTYSPVTGQLISVAFKVGQFVRQGQVLATIKSDQIGQLETDLLQQALDLKESIRQTQLQLELDRKIYIRENKLYTELISPRADVEAAQVQYEKDQALYRAQKNKLQSLIKSYQIRLSLYGASADVARNVVIQQRIFPLIYLTAPKSGLLIEKNINVGELVETNKNLFTIANLETVWLVAEVFEDDISKVHLGMPVNVNLDAFPGKVFRGKISFIATLLDPDTRTLEVRADVENKNLKLKPNMFARVEIVSSQKQSLTIPTSALQRNGDYTFAYKLMGGHRFLEQKVNTGLVSGSFTELLQGLRLGDQVVTEGSLALKGEILRQQAQAKY